MSSQWPYNPQLPQTPYGQMPQAYGAQTAMSSQPATAAQGGAGAISPAGGTQQFNPWAEPTDTVRRAIMALGLNPASPDQNIRAMMRNAQGVWSTGIGRLAQSGQGDAMATDPQAFQSFLQGIVSEGLKGGKILGGFAPSALSNLNQIASGALNAGPQGGGSPFANVLAEILSSDTNAQALASNLLFGGLPSALAQTLSAPLSNLPTLAAQQREQGALGAGTSRPGTALDLLRDLYQNMIYNRGF